MMKSMTAFAAIEKKIEGFEIAVEIRAYNSRNLDLSIRLPHGYLSLEDRVRSLVSERIARGRVELRAQIVEEQSPPTAFDIDVPRAAAYRKALEKLKTETDVSGEVTLELLMAAGGVVKSSETERNLEACWPALEACVGEAFDRLEEMRRREGEYIAADFLGRLAWIEERLERIEAAKADLVQQYQARLKERIALLTRGLVEIDPARIAQEAAILADRSDISEEIVRAASHADQFRAIMKGSEAAGRRLNFLLQEFSRELNTMGCKVGNAPICHMIVEVKAELEKIREQVQNIE
jgi:uncharacterized protein (TIGR00255 family)